VAGVSGVRIAVDGDEQVRAVRGVFLEVGLLPASALAVDLGVAVDEDQFIEVEPGQRTNVPGVYAAGDITGHRARQTVISAGEGAAAAVAAVDYIKAHNLGGDRKGLKLIQWGAAPASPAPKEAPEAGDEFVEY
jgi:thioredoxin reductase